MTETYLVLRIKVRGGSSWIKKGNAAYVWENLRLAMNNMHEVAESSAEIVEE